jgi:hypothetical protein
MTIHDLIDGEYYTRDFPDGDMVIFEFKKIYNLPMKIIHCYKCCMCVGDMGENDYHHYNTEEEPLHISLYQHSGVANLRASTQMEIDHLNEPIHG